MKPTRDILAGCGAAVRNDPRNAHLFSQPGITAQVKSPEKRIRQSNKPVMNDLESQFYRILLKDYPREDISIQAVTLKLANGLRYTTDFFLFKQCRAYEVKGRQAWDDSIVKLKVAASTFPQITFTLVWRDDSGWHQQVVLA